MTENDLRWVEIPIPLPPDGKNETFVLDGRELLLCNAGGTPYVVPDECPHAKISLQGGLIEGTILECPIHGGRLDLRNGEPVAKPIRRPTKCYPVRSVGGRLEIGLPAI
ncbi:MAG: Rieske 2Fe-2S domain-containing protein [Myxococcota bacterium]